MGKRPTSYDVAKRAGVSRTTVSYVLNHRHDVNISEETRRRVWQAIRELGYRPHPLARSLKTSSTQTLAVVVPDLNVPFYRSFQVTLEAYAARRGYATLVSTSGFDPDQEYLRIDSLLARQVDGLLIVDPLDEQNVRRAQEEGCAVVVVGTRLLDVACDQIWLDVSEGFEQGVAYLQEKGHARIGYAGGPRNSALAASLEASFRAAAAKAGLGDDDAPIHNGGFGYQAGYEAAVSFLQLEERPTAVVCAHDEEALGVIAAIRDCGGEVPRHLSVIGLGDTPVASMVRPRLSTIGHAAEEVTKMAASLLAERLFSSQSSSPPRCERVGTKLILRQTTAAI